MPSAIISGKELQFYKARGTRNSCESRKCRILFDSSVVRIDSFFPGTHCGGLIEISRRRP
jgi:hypothetical protein